MYKGCCRGYSAAKHIADFVCMHACMQCGYRLEVMHIHMLDISMHHDQVVAYLKTSQIAEIEERGK